MTSDGGVGARGLRLRRGNFELSIDSIRADPGKLVALIGTNGAGKSTLLDAVGGQLPIDSGLVQICGRSAASLSARERARHLAAVPQEFEIPFAYSVREVVEFGRAPYLGMLGRMRPQDRAAVSAALAECELENFVARPLGDLSGGQRRRVALAVALAPGHPDPAGRRTQRAYGHSPVTVVLATAAIPGPNRSGGAGGGARFKFRCRICRLHLLAPRWTPACRRTPGYGDQHRQPGSRIRSGGKCCSPRRSTAPGSAGNHAGNCGTGECRFRRRRW